MERKFEFKYNLLSDEYKLCFENDISKCDIERPIRNYIIRYNICLDEACVLSIDDKIEISFNIVYYCDSKYVIVVNGIDLNE